ncbi:hypothetical protein BASA50_000224 [Batrachochytrium salamandrivorans]|uniref:Clathrin/coatomer adaptor adaptin-like N-terminal domain-containing protein n=1 Tax=Batrachochytrium salamandrivorans TaxID=1357716 RepID=A0ABQ8EX68_9FUNG|nr:hypothetical protein BASA62_003191 [Batrachochytrium salamandrivorans]KAH6586860.1 hypothetical protein BASA50_000224 [Batrachochytrium salamandrivorans]
MQEFVDQCVIQLTHNTNGDLVVKLLQALRLAVVGPNISASVAVSVFFGKIRTCSSYNILAELLETIIAVTETKDILKTLLAPQVMEHFATLCTLVTDQHSRIRVLVLRLCEKFCVVPALRGYALQVIMSFLSDNEAIVQQTSLSLLVDIWSHPEIKQLLDINNLLDGVGTMLKCHAYSVRRSAITMLWNIAQGDPEVRQERETGSGGSRAVLFNNVFVQLCDFLNDSYPDLRAMALLLMGTMQQASPVLLWQTLSKQIGGVQKLRGSQNWGSTQNRKTPGDAGDFDISGDDVSLMDSNMCGAFIHGLEDEFSIVRSSAIDAICELACVSRKFADMCIPFLVDMFNDENRHIRLNAITSVAKISVMWKFALKSELTETMTLALFDGDSNIRCATHKLIGMISVDSPATLKTLVDVLQRAIGGFPQDNLSILQAFSHLGQAHPILVEGLMPVLLRLDSRFLPLAIRLENVQHTCNLVLILNGCFSSPHLIALLPMYVKEQYLYLREQYRDIIPRLPGMTGDSLLDMHQTEDMAVFDIRPSLEKHCLRLGHDPLKAVSKSTITARMDRDLRLLSQKNISHSVLYECLSLAILHDGIKVLSDTFSGVPVGILSSIMETTKSQQSLGKYIWSIPVEVRKKSALVSILDSIPLDIRGRVLVVFPCKISISNVSDISVLSVEVNIGGLAVSNLPLVCQSATFIRPMEWVVNIDLSVDVGNANGPLDINIVSKIGHVVSSTTTKCFEFKT